MQNNVYIPTKINVGFQNRRDTYTGKLAYIIYFDEKDKLRKEASWEGWRDKEIDPIICSNEPLSGFVLNKKAGGYASGWNHRNAYIRVYDPRNFEFEISIENLLYILENTNSIKGKGLEGEFVYGWSKGDLVLIPLSSSDYKNIREFSNNVQSNKKIGVKDLKIGATYQTKQNELWIYMGKFDRYDSWQRKDKEAKSNGEYHWFCTERKYYDGGTYKDFETIKSPSGKIISVEDENCIENYAELFDEMESNPKYSPIDYENVQYKKYNPGEITLHDERHKYLYLEDGTELYVYESYKKEGIYDLRDRTSRIDILSEKTLPEICEQYEFYYKNEYLKNGKMYRSSK